MPPYDIKSQIQFRLIDVTTYQKFMQRYDPELLTMVAPLEPKLMNESLYLINCDMQPDNKQWMYFYKKNKGYGRMLASL